VAGRLTPKEKAVGKRGESWGGKILVRDEYTPRGMGGGCKPGEPGRNLSQCAKKGREGFSGERGSL